ncbi:MAG TPA: outer membrane beta-barrel protein [Gemmatimonadaceae bacterium]|nr:outer membrane beta-barrel protein [Gemmatimonadaceae bacterium]
MQSRLMISGAVGLALALTLGGSTAAAQQTDTSRVRQDTSASRTSTQRIPVRKDMSTTTESTGAIAPRDTTTAVPQQDTTSMVTQDTTTVQRDTTTVVTTPAPTTTDTTTLATVTEQPVMGPIPGGWYFGVGGGASIPSGDLGDGFDTGWNAGAMLGWRPMNSIWGLRLDGSYSRLNSQLNSDNQLTNWNAMLDLTLDFPIGQNGSSFYLLGGVGLHNFAWDFEGTDEDPNQTFDGLEDATDFGVNGGAGVSFALGRTNLFVEGRLVNVFNGNDNVSDTRLIPVTAGLRWFF